MGLRVNPPLDKIDIMLVERDRQARVSFVQLDHHESRRGSFTLGFVLQVVFVVLMVRFAAYAPKITQLRTRQTVELVTPTFFQEKKAVRMVAPQLPKPIPRPEPLIESKQIPELPPPPVVAKVEPPKPIQPPVQKPEIALNHFSSAPVAPVPGPPRPTIKTDVFAHTAPKQTTIEAPPQRVQTGGFGDENGFRGQTTQEAKLNAPKLGSFDKAEGTGSGNGSAGTKGVPGIVASAGFGSGTVAVAGNSTTPGGGVRSGGFGDARPSGGEFASPAKTSSPALIPVEVLEKPQPLYTAEARSLKIEGEVHLKVVFQASGRVQVLQVVRGLGHGLDEAATVAAQKIRFKPAQRDGQPCDMTATVHIVFQLAS